MKLTNVSVISTVLNEGTKIKELLEGLASQTLLPGEIIIVDAGSEDETVPTLQEYSSLLPLKVIICKKATRGKGRNIAIKEAKGEIIASIDGGCIPYSDWLEKLVSPFYQDPTIDVVSGFYEPIISSPMQEALACLTVPQLRDINPDDFLPSSRSIAFRKRIWEKVGGYPEWMKSAEDTLFDLKLKQAGAKFFFQPNAKVKWRIRNSLRGVFRQFYEYSFWDAQAGVFFPHYHKIWLYIDGVALLILSLFFPWLLLFLLAGFLLYISRYFKKARKRQISLSAYLWLLPVLLAYDLGNVSGFVMGKFFRIFKISKGGEIIVC
ncbi:glycosyltransferase [bacterium]|nr:glycosyltransferase [bacterium]